MSLKTYYELLNDLAFPEVELSNMEYARVFLDDSAMAQDFVNKINEMKDALSRAADVEIGAEIVGRHNSIVMISGIGHLYERSSESYQMVKDLISRYISGQDEGGSMKQILKVSPRRKTKNSQSDQDTAPKETEPKPRTVTKTKKPSTKPKQDTPKPKSDQPKRNIDGLVYDDDIEQLFTEIIVREEVETCNTLITRAVEEFGMGEGEAREKMESWLEKNSGNDKLEYEPEFGDGEGLIRMF